MVVVCLFASLCKAREVQVWVRDASGASIARATGRLQCESRDLGEVLLDRTFELPEQDCIVTVRAHGFSEKPVSVAKDATAVEAILRPKPVAETVVVTASRATFGGDDLPVAQVTKNAEQMVESPAITIDDKLRQIPGFTLFRRSGSQTANPTSQGVSLRGLGASGASRSLVLEDGVPMNDPFGGWVYWARVPVESIEAVDVLEGGTSDLYGSNALGGVVNIRTWQPMETSFAAQTFFGSSSTPMGSGTATVRAGKWGTTLAGEGFDTNGYIAVPQSARGRVDTPVASEHATGDVTLERDSENTRFFVRGNLFGESRDNGTLAQFNTTTVRQLATGADLRNAWGRFTLRAFGGTQSLHQTFSAVAADRNSETLTTDQRVPVQQYGFTAQWSKLLGTRHLLAAGVDGRDVAGDTNELQYVSGRPAANFIAGGRQQALGLYLEDVIQVTNRWLIVGSVRGDLWSNKDAASRRFPFAGSPTLTYFPNRSEAAVSPRGGVTRIVNDRLSLYASAYRSFRAPTLNELYRPFRVGNVQTQANSDLNAEHFTGGETGANLSPTQWLRMRGTFFTGYLSDAVGNITLNSTPLLITRQRQNLGRVRTTGVELASNATLRKDLTLSLNYQFIDAVVKEFRSDPTLVGLRTPLVPRHAFTMQATYANPKAVTLSVQGRAAGGEYDDDRNQFPLGSYFNLGIFVSRRLQEHVSIFGAVDNVLNSRYAIAKTPLEMLAAPVSGRVGLRFEYGERH